MLLCFIGPSCPVLYCSFTQRWMSHLTVIGLWVGCHSYVMTARPHLLLLLLIQLHYSPIIDRLITNWEMEILLAFSLSLFRFRWLKDVLIGVFLIETDSRHSLLFIYIDSFLLLSLSSFTPFLSSFCWPTDSWVGFFFVFFLLSVSVQTTSFVSQTAFERIVFIICVWYSGKRPCVASDWFYFITCSCCYSARYCGSRSFVYYCCSHSDIGENRAPWIEMAYCWVSLNFIGERRSGDRDVIKESILKLIQMSIAVW